MRVQPYYVDSTEEKAKRDARPVGEKFAYMIKNYRSLKLRLKEKEERTEAFKQTTKYKEDVKELTNKMYWYKNAIPKILAPHLDDPAVQLMQDIYDFEIISGMPYQKYKYTEWLFCKHVQAELDKPEVRRSIITTGWHNYYDNYFNKKLTEEQKQALHNEGHTYFDIYRYMI